jgi:hypothetical protein
MIIKEDGRRDGQWLGWNSILEKFQTLLLNVASIQSNGKSCGLSLLLKEELVIQLKVFHWTQHRQISPN